MTTQQLRFEMAIPAPQAPHRDFRKAGGALLLLVFATLAWHLPKFTVAPAALDYGNTRVGGGSTLRPLMLTNRTSVEIHPIIKIIGEATSDFDYERQNCTGINTGETCQLPVEFRPRAPGLRRARLVIDFGSGESTAVELTGTGFRTTIQIRPSDLDFGRLPLGQSSDVKPVTIEGEEWFHIRAVSVQGPAAGEFKVNAAACIQNTNELKRCEISVQSQPHTAGLHEAVIKIDDGVGDSHAVLLHSAGAFPSSKSPSPTKSPQANHTPVLKPASIRIDPMVLDFSSQPRRSHQVSIWNDGQEPLQIKRVQVLEAGCDRFAVQGNACTALPAGASCLITVGFNSRNLGNTLNCSASLQVEHDAQNIGTPQNIGLQWNKANEPRPHVTVIADSLNFYGSLTQNRLTDIPPQMVTIRNDGQVEFTDLSLLLRTSDGMRVAHFQQTSHCRHLQVNEECQAQVSFSASTAGAYTAKLYVLQSMVKTMAVVQVNATVKAPISGVTTSQQSIIHDNAKTSGTPNIQKPAVSNDSKMLGVFAPKTGVTSTSQKIEGPTTQKVALPATKFRTRKPKTPPADPIVR